MAIPVQNFCKFMLAEKTHELPEEQCKLYQVKQAQLLPNLAEDGFNTIEKIRSKPLENKFGIHLTNNKDLPSYALLVKNLCSPKDMADGKLVHADIMTNGYGQERFLRNLLIEMYGKCGSLDDAHGIFDKIETRNVFSWTSMIAAYVYHKEWDDALEFFKQMLLERIKPNRFTFTIILGVCSSMFALADGKLIHAFILDARLGSDIFVATAVVYMYGKFKLLDELVRVFDRMNRWDVITWTATIAAYADDEHANAAMELFRQMQLAGITPNKYSFTVILNSCSSVKELGKGKVIHAGILHATYDSDVVIGNALVNMYSKCNSLVEAERVFESMHKRDIISWNAMISAYNQNDNPEHAFQVFHKMQQYHVRPDKITLVSILDPCASLAFFAEGKRMHAHIVSNNCESDIIVRNTLLNMYGKCGSVRDAQKIFGQLHKRDIVSWNAMIAAYAQNGHGEDALSIFRQSQEICVKPDKYTFVSILDACAILAFIEIGKWMHASIISNGFEMDPVVGNALLNMYGKCWSLEHAHIVFFWMHQRDLVSWTAMIAACTQHSDEIQALKHFKDMQNEGIAPNMVSLVGIMDACASLAATTAAKDIHACMINCGFQCNSVLSCAIINMYGKCGNLNDAKEVFLRMHEHDVVSWTALIAVYAQHGQCTSARQVFDDMQQEGIWPNDVTFISTLSACSHAGAMDEGSYLFLSMSQGYGLIPTIRQFGCLIDIVGRVGFLDEALELLLNIPVEADAFAWTSLLTACTTHGDMGRGKSVAALILELNANNAGLYVMLSNIYASWEMDD